MMNRRKIFFGKWFWICFAVCSCQMLTAALSEEELIVKGNVTDVNGEPLIGATITVRDNPALGAITDMDGNYSVKVPDRYAILQINYVGFVPKEEMVGNRRIINVVLQEDIGQLDEVVVVGYGTQKKASVVASISTVAPQKLKVGTTRSLSNNLAGSLSGVLAVQRTGEPGYDNSEFWIRGISTFQGDNKPLVLVDGVERSLNDLDLAEIESLSVLKDASASAVYGVRGANGVILITTKRGTAGKIKINTSVEHSISQPVQLPDFMNSYEQLCLLNRIRQQDSGQNFLKEEVIERYRTGYDPEVYPDVNWIEVITKDFAQNTRATFDVSGGSELLRYSVVGAYYNEQGITVTAPNTTWDSSIRLNRFNLRTNVDINLTKTTVLRVNIGGYLQRRKAPSAGIDGVFNEAFNTPPFSSITMYKDGRLPKPKEGQNPWALLTQTGYVRENKSKLESLFSIEQDLKKILPGLKIRGMFSFDYYSMNGMKRSRTPFYYYPASESSRDPETGELNLIASNPSEGHSDLVNSQINEYGNNSTYIEANITYDRTFGEHTVNALLLYNQRDYDDGETKYAIPYRTQGFAGRAAYSYGGRYVAEFNFGYNGTENFPVKHRFGFFPSLAVGWILSEEPFMASLKPVFDRIKFRASYGTAGNDRIGGERFAYITRINEDGGGYKWGNSLEEYSRAGRREGLIGVDNLVWETVVKANLGIEVGILNMLQLQVDAFNDNRKDILMQRNNIPNSAGFVQNPWANYGKVNNKGVDASLEFNKQITKDWFLSARGTFTFARNKIIEQDEELGKIGTLRSSTGKPVGQIFGLAVDRLFTADDFDADGELKPGIPKQAYSARLYPGDIKYIDQDGDGEITSRDEIAIGGTENPEIIYGFGLNTSYKNFDFGVFLQGNGRTFKMIGRGKEFLPGAQAGAYGNIYKNANDAWTEENPCQDSFYPRLHFGLNENNRQASEWWLKDMSMLRLKNIELGYSLPADIIRHAGMSFVRVFARGTNLLRFSKFSLWDPELGTDNGLRYPIMRTLSVGLDIRF